MVNRADIKLAIVEDDDAVRESLTFLLRGKGFSVVGAYPSAEALFEEIDRVVAGLILLDLELPGMSGAEALRVLRKRRPQPDVVVLTVFDDRESLFSVLKAGASGYILKDTPLDQLCKALEEVAEGGAPMSPAIARRVLKEFQTEDADGLEALTHRETEVLQLLVQGFTYEEIGARLFISAGTVQVHLKKTYRKMGVRSRTAAVAKALRNHLVD